MFEIIRNIYNMNHADDKYGAVKIDFPNIVFNMCAFVSSVSSHD